MGRLVGVGWGEEGGGGGVGGTEKSARKGEGGRMWPFFSGKKEKEPEGTQERLDRIETAIRRLQEEWTDVYAKFRTMQMRVAKQVQRSEQASSQPEEPGNGGSAELMVGANHQLSTPSVTGLLWLRGGLLGPLHLFSYAHLHGPKFSIHVRPLFL